MSKVKMILSMLALTIIAGAASASVNYVDSVDAYDTERYTATFRAGEAVTLVVAGDGDTDLDLYIYDENGNLIASDTDYTDFCVTSWCPRWTGQFTIVVENHGSVYNRFHMYTR